jgi:hypothetical protein
MTCTQLRKQKKCFQVSQIFYSVFFFFLLFTMMTIAFLHNTTQHNTTQHNMNFAAFIYCTGCRSNAPVVFCRTMYFCNTCLLKHKCQGKEQHTTMFGVSRRSISETLSGANVRIITVICCSLFDIFVLFIFVGQRERQLKQPKLNTVGEKRKAEQGPILAAVCTKQNDVSSFFIVHLLA